MENLSLVLETKDGIHTSEIVSSGCQTIESEEGLICLPFLPIKNGFLRVDGNTLTESHKQPEHCSP